MSALVSSVLAVIGLIVSANTKLHAVLLGQPVTVPALWLVLVAVVLALAAVVLHLIRAIMQDRPVRESRPVHVITSLR